MWDWVFILILSAEAVLLGFQHYLVMLGTTVLIPSALVPQMGGRNVRLFSRRLDVQMYFSGLLLDLRLWFWQEEKAKLIQTILFVAGLNTLLQTVFGTRLPAIIGASYTFVPVTISIMLSRRFNDIADPVEVSSSHLLTIHFCFYLFGLLLLLINCWLAWLLVYTKIPFWYLVSDLRG